MPQQTATTKLKTSRCCIITLVYAISLSACTGGSIAFDRANTQTDTDENTNGIFWKAQVQVQGDVKNILYKISGSDAGLLVINSATGELSFKIPADFETPIDSDKKNMYEVDIEATAANNSAKQHLKIAIKDVSRPVISLEKPRPNENVGTDKPGSMEIETVVRFFDAESNIPIKDGIVTLNTSALIQDAVDPQLWKGKITVPEGGADVALTGFLADKTPIKSATQLFNKRDSINPSYLAVSPGRYLVFFDPDRSMIGRISLENGLWYSHITNSSLPSHFPTFDWNSTREDIYLLQNNTNNIYALGLRSAWSLDIFYAGYIPGVVNLTYDYTNQRLIALAKNTEAGSSQYRALALATDNTNGFVNAQPNTGSPIPAITQLLWELPNDIILGTFKYFNFHRASKTYIIADERNINNIQQTLVRGFGEHGQKKFEALIGPDISNLTINEKESLVYVAENHSLATGKIKSININNGDVADLIDSYGTSAVGAYSSIRIDIPNKLLYIGDDVSDSVFVVDLTTRSMSQINISSSTTISNTQ
ncbi:MAG TPA: cadherin repeat domain-containing protein [Cellvibrionaceae bacterium]